MTDFKRIFWGFIFSAVGIAFGWMLNQLGQWSRTRQEDKKNLKIVLFNLLETYFIFIRSDVEKLISKVTDKIILKMPIDLQTKEAKDFMQTLYTGILTSYLRPELTEELKLVQQAYQDSIKTLASIDPLTAYYLSGRTNIFDHFDKMNGLSESLKQQFPTEHNEIEIGTKSAVEIIKPDILQDALNDIENDIREIAWKINPYVWFKSKKAINRLKLNASGQLDKEIDTLLEKLTPLFEGQV